MLTSGHIPRPYVLSYALGEHAVYSVSYYVVYDPSVLCNRRRTCRFLFTPLHPIELYTRSQCVCAFVRWLTFKMHAKRIIAAPEAKSEQVIFFTPHTQPIDITYTLCYVCHFVRCARVAATSGMQTNPCTARAPHQRREIDHKARAGNCVNHATDKW